MDIEKFQVDRYKYLLRVYELNIENSSKLPAGNEIAIELGFDGLYARKIKESLYDKGFIKPITQDRGWFQITPLGRQHVEQIEINRNNPSTQIVNNGPSVAAYDNSKVTIHKIIHNDNSSEKHQENLIIKYSMEIIIGVIVIIIGGYLLYKFGFN